MNIIEELEWRGLVADCTDAPELRKRLETPITLYCGFDPTADSLHVGNLVPLLALRRFQLLGHLPIALAGGATGSIGDPSGKTAERALLGKETLDHNIASIKSQLRRLLDFDAKTNPARPTRPSAGRNSPPVASSAFGGRVRLSPHHVPPRGDFRQFHYGIERYLELPCRPERRRRHAAARQIRHDPATAAMNKPGKLKIGLYLAAIFVAGLVTGVFVTVQVGRHMMPGEGDMAAHWCRDLQSKMNLTPGQMDNIRPIVNDAISEFKNRVSNDMSLNLSNCNARIAAELTLEQKPKFEQIQKEQQGMIRAMFEGGTNGAPKKP